MLMARWIAWSMHVVDPLVPQLMAKAAVPPVVTDDPLTAIMFSPPTLLYNTKG